MSTLVVNEIQDSGGGNLLGRRNAIINGNFGVNQRAVSGSVVLAAGEYGHDMWKAGAGGCSYTFATSENVTTITISAGSLKQIISGDDLQSGTYVLSWTGTVQMKIAGGSAGDNGMTGTVTGGTNTEIETSGTGTLSLVQFEKGSKATPFGFREDNDKHRCTAYYQITTYFGRFTSNTYNYSSNNWPTEMRSEPSISYTVTSSTSASLAGGGVEPRGTASYDVLHLNSAVGGQLRATIIGDCSP